MSVWWIRSPLETKYFRWNHRSLRLPGQEPFELSEKIQSACRSCFLFIIIIIIVVVVVVMIIIMIVILLMLMRICKYILIIMIIIITIYTCDLFILLYNSLNLGWVWTHVHMATVQAMVWARLWGHPALCNIHHGLCNFRSDSSVQKQSNLLLPVSLSAFFV